MVTIVFSQFEPSSSSQPSGATPKGSVPEENFESDDWDAPTLGQLLARQKPKPAHTLMHSSYANVAGDEIGSKCSTKFPPINTHVQTDELAGRRAFSSRPQGNKELCNPIELCLGSNLSKSREDHHNPVENSFHPTASVSNNVPKSSYTIIPRQGKPTLVSSQDDFGHRFTKTHGYNSANGKDKSPSLRHDAPIGLCRSEDGVSNEDGNGNRWKTNITAGNAYDIFAEYEKIFGTSQNYKRGDGNEGGNEQEWAGDGNSRAFALQTAKKRVIPSGSSTSRAAAALEGNSGAVKTGVSPPGSASSTHDPSCDFRCISPLPAASGHPTKRSRGRLSISAACDAKRARVSETLVPYTDRPGTVQATLGPVMQAQVHTNISSSNQDSTKETSLEPSTASKEGLPPVDPEDNQFLVERLLKRRIRRCRGRKVARYLVQWKGYSAEHNSWVYEGDIHEDLIRGFAADL